MKNGKFIAGPEYVWKFSFGYIVPGAGSSFAGVCENGLTVGPYRCAQEFERWHATYVSGLFSLNVKGIRTIWTDQIKGCMLLCKATVYWVLQCLFLYIFLSINLKSNKMNKNLL